MKLVLMSFSVMMMFGSCIAEPLTGPQTSIGTPPPEFFLKQNFPNPFTDTTTIEYGVPATGGAASNVSVIVYDPLLEPVRTLVNNSTHSAGVFRTKWDGRNIRGIQVSSGTYTIQMQGFSPQTVVISILAIKK